MIDTFQGSAAMIEKRMSPRQRVLKRGTLAFCGGGVDCMVRNVSTGGARLDVANPLGLPPSFTLVITADQFMRRCHPVWCSDTRIGVAFD
jgi:PilZ domain